MFGHRLLTTVSCFLLCQPGDRRHKSTVQYASRPNLPKLAYRRVKGKSPGVVFLPGYGSNMNGQKAESLEEFCRSLGHSCLRYVMQRPCHAQNFIRNTIEIGSTRLVYYRARWSIKYNRIGTKYARTHNIAAITYPNLHPH